MMMRSSCSSLNTTTTSSSEGEGAAAGARARAAAGTTTVLKKGPWTAAEDSILMEYVQKHGEGNWNSVQKNSGLSRCGKSCRLRWANHLRPNLKKGSFNPEEEMLILQLHAQLGNKWARMAAQLPGRTDNEIKNYWNTRVKRRQRAGLPLYPTDLQLQQAAQAHHHHPRSMGSLQPPALLVPPSSSSSPSSPLQHPPSLLQLPASMPLLLNYAMPETPSVKRVRDDRLTFQFPLSPVVSPHMQQQQQHYHQMSANNNNINMFQYNYLPMPLPARMELPSTQLFNNGGGGGGGDSTCGLLDALLQEAQGVGVNVVQRRRLLVSDSIGAVKDENGGSGGGKDSFEVEESWQCSNGMNAKSERAGEMNPASPNDDISRLFDTISTAGMPAAASEWYNNDNAAASCCEISNGEQSSASAAGDELGLELQHLTSSLSVAPAEQDWNIGSCSWSNMPGIC